MPGGQYERLWNDVAQRMLDQIPGGPFPEARAATVSAPARNRWGPRVVDGGVWEGIDARVLDAPRFDGVRTGTVDETPRAAPR